MRIGLVAFLLLLTATVPAAAQLSIGISIGSYPSFMAVPGYPVYYAPDVGANYFFYDGLYWVYQDDNWYSSSWYNGPWDMVGPMYVPIYVLQVPVRYYRRPPQFFIGWQADRPPRWNDHWGHDWAQRRQDWDRPQQSARPAPAPLPDYQRRYSGKDYPRAEQQQALRQQNYHYQSQNPAASRDSGEQSGERRSGPVQPSVQQPPPREADRVRPNQSRPAPQQEQPRQQEQRDQPTKQVRSAPPREQRPSPAPNEERPRAPAAHDPGNAGAGAPARKGPDAGHNPEQKPREDQPGEPGKKRDKDGKPD